MAYWFRWNLIYTVQLATLLPPLMAPSHLRWTYVMPKIEVELQKNIQTPATKLPFYAWVVELMPHKTAHAIQS